MAEKEISPEEKAKFEKDEASARDKNIYLISKIIGAINPDLYSDNKSDVKKLLKSNQFWAAVDKVKPKPLKKYNLIYNSPYETLEPVYFWILDFLGPDRTEKLVDNFQSSPGSGHFSELMGKATRMQEEGMKVMQTIGVLIKSIINIIYDLRQFEIRLGDYDAARDKDKSKSEAGLLALKQTWLDNVDIKRGNTSIKAMAFSQASFATLIDAFMVASNLEQITKKPEDGGLDLNERVKRILEQRFLEFQKWKDLSEDELRKRFNIERAYLRSQVDSLKLYARWAKPYLKSAEELRMMNSSSAALVKAFNTIILELTLMKTDGVKVDQEIIDKNLPEEFKRWLEKGKIREYYACTFVDLKFRGIPQRADQHYTFGGRVDASFMGYALTKQEIAMLKEKLDQADLNQSLNLVQGATQDSLKEIQNDIDHYLKGVPDKPKKEEGDINPFAALFGIKKKTKEERKAEDESQKEAKIKEGLKPDNYAESMVREIAKKNAAKSAYAVYDVYKKSHGMPSTKEQV